jgi:hypothetical protein
LHQNIAAIPVVAEDIVLLFVFPVLSKNLLQRG